MRLHCLKDLRKEPLQNRTRSFSNAKELLKSFQINEHILKNKKKGKQNLFTFFLVQTQRKTIEFCCFGPLSWLMFFIHDFEHLR